MASEDPVVPPHVEERVAKIAELHAADYREAGALQKLASSATAAVGRDVGRMERAGPVPHSGGGRLGHRSLRRGDDPRRPAPRRRTRDPARPADARDRDPLRAENGEDHRALEEFRRNDWRQSDERDKVAEALAEASDPEAVLGAIKAAHGDAAGGRGRAGSVKVLALGVRRRSAALGGKQATGERRERAQ
jgi:hypothetical protein